jgi:hypothetical protein
MALFVDSVLVSRLLGINRMPAIQLCMPIVTFVNLVYWMLGLGGSLLASNATADHDRERANRLFTASMTALIVFGVLVAALGSVFRGQLVGFLCHDAALVGDVTEYCSVLVLGMPLLCYIMSLSYFARSDGSPKLSFQAVLISNVINRPIEKAVNQYYINDAKRILKSVPGLQIIGVTGSYGKTSVKFYLQTLLQGKYNVLVTPESYNTPMGIVKTIRGSLKSTHEIFICEMGARHVGDIKEDTDIVHPHHGVITSVGPQHLETFHSMENTVICNNRQADLSDRIRNINVFQIIHPVNSALLNCPDRS